MSPLIGLLYTIAQIAAVGFVLGCVLAVIVICTRKP